MKKNIIWLLISVLLSCQSLSADDKSFEEYLDDADVVVSGGIYGADKWPDYNDEPQKGFPLCIREWFIVKNKKGLVARCIAVDKFSKKGGLFLLKYNAALQMFNIVKRYEYSIGNEIKVYTYKKDILKTTKVFPEEKTVTINDNIKLIYYRKKYIGGSSTTLAFLVYKNQSGKIYYIDGKYKKHSVTSADSAFVFFIVSGGQGAGHSHATVFKIKCDNMEEIARTTGSSSGGTKFEDIDNDGTYEITSNVKIFYNALYFPMVLKFENGTFNDSSLEFRDFYNDKIRKEQKLINGNFNGPRIFGDFARYKAYKIQRMFGLDEKAGLEEGLKWIENDNDSIRAVGMLTLYEIDNVKAKEAVLKFKQEYSNEYKFCIKKLKELPKNKANTDKQTTMSQD